MDDLKKIKPFLRGRFHEGAAFVAFGACLMLLGKCHSTRSYLAVVIYSLSLIGLLTISAIYHRIHWQEKGRAFMRKLDHAAIFALIAGTMTPFFMLTLPAPDDLQAMSLIWGVAIFGIIQVIFWIHAPKWLAAILYVIAGWLVMPYFSQITNFIGKSGATLIIIGGVIYTLGAVVYAVKKPDPWPKTFGYHEIFHIAVIIGAIFHFIVISQLLNKIS